MGWSLPAHWVTLGRRAVVENGNTNFDLSKTFALGDPPRYEPGPEESIAALDDISQHADPRASDVRLLTDIDEGLDGLVRHNAVGLCARRGEVQIAHQGPDRIAADQVHRPRDRSLDVFGSRVAGVPEQIGDVDDKR